MSSPSSSPEREPTKTESKKGKLDRERAERLTALGVVWDQLEAEWEANFAALEAYKAANGGDPNCPDNYVTEDGRKLGMWLSNQRRGHKNGKLDRERAERLTALGVRW